MIERNYLVHNIELHSYIKNKYTVKDLNNLYGFLKSKGTFNFNKLETGLFSAAQLDEKNIHTNYDKVWVRDNIYIAYAHYVNGEYEIARNTIFGIGNFFFKYKHKLSQIIDGVKDYTEPMNRLHIRFDGVHLKELNEKWGHAQNDALGYYLWLLVKMANENLIILRNQELELIPLFLSYFKKIEYWKDADNGHWEETRKVNASSIGIVVGALVQLKIFLTENKNEQNILKMVSHLLEQVEDLFTYGTDELNKILPYECIQKGKNTYREVDGALLFLIFPIILFEGVLDKSKEDEILQNIISNLQGEFGIKRYLGDSFWTANTKMKQSLSDITADYSDKIEERDKYHILGEEAQWCIFDSIISVIYGRKFLQSGSDEHYEYQVHYFNRSLAQITGEDCIYGAFKCPELYYIEEGNYTYNDTVPLLWAQANLWVTFKYMKDSILKHTGK